VFARHSSTTADDHSQRRYFGQATLDLYDQLYLTAALRNDGSPASASRTGAVVPKGSLAWTFTKVTGERRG